MLAKTLVVFYVWSLEIFLLFIKNPFSGIVYSIMLNRTLPYHYALNDPSGNVTYG